MTKREWLQLAATWARAAERRRRNHPYNRICWLYTMRAVMTELEP